MWRDGPGMGILPSDLDVGRSQEEKVYIYLNEKRRFDHCVEKIWCWQQLYRSKSEQVVRTPWPCRSISGRSYF